MSSVSKSTTRGRRIYAEHFAVTVCASSISELFDAPTIYHHEWRSNNEVKSYMQMLQTYFANYSVESFEIHAEETLWISDEYVSLKVESLTAKTMDGQTIAFDVAITNNYFCEYKDNFDVEEETPEEM